MSFCLHVLHKVRTITQKKREFKKETVLPRTPTIGKKSKVKLKLIKMRLAESKASLENLSQKLPFFYTTFTFYTHHLEERLKSQRNAGGHLSVLCISHSQLTEFQTFARNTTYQSCLKWMSFHY